MTHAGSTQCGIPQRFVVRTAAEIWGARGGPLVQYRMAKSLLYHAMAPVPKGTSLFSALALFVVNARPLLALILLNGEISYSPEA